MMADHKRTLQENNAALVTQLEELRKNSALTQQQKDELDARITTLSQQHLTEQQKLQLQLDQATKKAKTEAETLAREATQWKSAFEGTMIENAVLAGSTEHKAVNAGQMLDLLRGKAKVVPELDGAGQPTGKYLVKLPVTVTDPKTKAKQVMELDAVEAIGKMREDPANGNLFMFDGKTGLGGTNHPNNTAPNDGTPDFSKMTPGQYQKWRKENMK
jgi:predicted RNase H-like nuclease (RuvC/YqgF family)